jgi:hypothetical protein
LRALMMFGSLAMSRDRVGGEAAVNQPTELHAQPGCPLGQWDQGPGSIEPQADHLEEVRGIAQLERQFPAQHQIGHHAEREDIRGWTQVVVLPRELLRGHEQRAALDPARSAGELPHSPRDAEVQQHDAGGLGSPKHQVLWLEIEVNKAQVMSCPQCGADLANHRAGSPMAERALAELAIEIPPIDPLEHEVRAPRSQLTAIEQIDDITAPRQQCQALGLSLEVLSTGRADRSSGDQFDPESRSSFLGMSRAGPAGDRAVSSLRGPREAPVGDS